jgi:hypothetical protein
MAEPDKPWDPKIRSTKKLRIKNNAEAGMWSGIVTQSVPIFNNAAVKAMEYELVSEGKAEVVVKIAGANKSDPKFGDSAVHGKTLYGNGLKGLEEVEIFLPAQITQSHTNVLLHILLHEMAHAAGLVDHSSDGILVTVPNIYANGTLSATATSKKMPPFFLSNKTIVRLKKIW